MSSIETILSRCQCAKKCIVNHSLFCVPVKPAKNLVCSICRCERKSTYRDCFETRSCGCAGKFVTPVPYCPLTAGVVIASGRDSLFPFGREWLHLIPYSPVVTVCPPRSNIKKFHVLPTQCICVFCTDFRTNSGYFPVQH